MSDDNTGNGPDNSGGTGTDDALNDQNDTSAADNAGDDKPVTREEFNKLFEKMRNADKRATAAEKDAKAKQAALDKIEADKLGDVEKAKKEAADAAAERDATAAELKKTKLETAFVKQSDIKWHDADTAYAILTSQYMDGVEIDDSGVVKGMADAVKKLVKDKPFLVNAGPAGGPTGSSHNGRTGDSADQKKSRAEDLKKRMPAAFRPM